MNILHLIYFKTVAETGNMTQASKTLYVAQPALSKTISTLEDEWGYPLFDRIGKNISLNENGKIFLKYVNKMLGCLEDAKKETEDYLENADYTIYVQILAGARYFVSLLTEYQNLHPYIHFHYLDVDSNNSVKPIPDIKIFAADTDMSSEYCKILLEESYKLAVPIANPLSTRDYVTAEDLVDETFMTAANGYAIRDAFDAYCKEHQLSPDISYQTENTSLMKTMLTSGAGLSIVPSLTWADLEEWGHCRLITISDISFKRYIHVQWNKERYISEACRTTLDYLFESVMTQ